MKRYAWMLAAAATIAGGLAWAQSTATAPDPLAESRKIEAEIQKLRESKTGKAFEEIDERYEMVAERENKAREAIEKAQTALRESPEGKAYIEKMNALHAKQKSKWEIERGNIAKAAKTLYEARHAELLSRAAGELPEARKLGLDAFTYPVVDGSTSAHPLGVILASRVLGVKYAWAYPEPSGYEYGVRPMIPGDAYLPSLGSDRPWGEGDHEFRLAASLAYARTDLPGQRRMALLINSDLAQTSTTHEAYKRLIEGKCDLNLTARAPSEDELKVAKEKGVKIALVPIATDALVFFVNTQNPVKGLSKKQIIDVYEGTLESWKALGWDKAESRDAKITPLWRERNSGSRELFDALVMKGRPAPDEKQIGKLYSSGMGGPFSRATTDASVLAHSVYYYDHFMAMSAFTRTIAVDGVEPRFDTIASGKYPLTTPVYAAYREGSPKDSPAMRLLSWIVSDEGQRVVRESGYVPVKGK